MVEAHPAIESGTVVCFGCATAMRVAATNDRPCTCGMCGSVLEPENVATNAPPDASDFVPDTSTPPGECPGCIEARAYLGRMRDTRTRNGETPESDTPRVDRVRLSRCRNGWLYCDVCTQPNGEPTIVSLDDRGREAALDVTVRRARDADQRLTRKKMLDDFDNLARCRPYLEGKGTEPSPIVGDGNRGGGAKLSATDRPDWVNEAGQSLSRAMETARRLDMLLASARIDRHVREAQRTTASSRLRRIREQLGISRADLAERMVLALGESAFVVDVRPLKRPMWNFLRWLKHFCETVILTHEMHEKWIEIHEDAPGFTIARSTVRTLAPFYAWDEDDLFEHLTADDTPAPTELERGVAVLHWLSMRVGPTHRKRIVESIGAAFGGRAVGEELHAKRAELVRRRQIVPLKPEAIAAERERIAREASETVAVIHAERDRAFDDLAIRRAWNDPGIGECEMAIESCNNALSQAYATRMRDTDALETKITEGRRALTPEQFRAAVARLPSPPTTEAVRAMGTELLGLAEEAWKSVKPVDEEEDA